MIYNLVCYLVLFSHFGNSENVSRDSYYDGFIVEDDTVQVKKAVTHLKNNIAKSVIAKVDAHGTTRDSIERRHYKPGIGNMALTLMPKKNTSVQEIHNDTVAVKSIQPTTFHPNLGRGSMALSYTPKKHNEEPPSNESLKKDGNLAAIELLAHLKPKLNLEHTLIKLANDSFHKVDKSSNERSNSKKANEGLESVFSKIQPDIKPINVSARRNMLTNSTLKGFLSKNVNYTFKDVNKPKENTKTPAANEKLFSMTPKRIFVNSSTQSHFFQNLYSKLYAKHHPGHNAVQGAAALIPVSHKLSAKKPENGSHALKTDTHVLKHVPNFQNISSTGHIPASTNQITRNISLGLTPIKTNNTSNFELHNSSVNATLKNHTNYNGQNLTSQNQTVKHEKLIQSFASLNSTESVDALTNAVTNGDDTVQFINAIDQHRIHLIDPNELETLKHSDKGIGVKRKDVIDDQTQTECGTNSTCPEGKYCHNLLCYACHRKHHECLSDSQCCNAMPCVYGRCDEKPKGSPGTICNIDSDCGDNGCCVIEPTINEKHGICKRRLEEFHQCSPVLFRKVWIGDEKPSCGPCVDGLECVEKGVSASHLICMKKKD